MPPLTAVVPGARTSANIWLDNSSITFQARDPRNQQHLIDAITNHQARSLYIPLSGAVDDLLISRFLAKVALEILTIRVLDSAGWEQNIIDDNQLDALRRFARVGDRPIQWPFSRRRIYGEDDLQAGDYQVLHEFTLLYTDKNELFAVVCLFGEEFAINCAGPAINGYAGWLLQHNQQSPLYVSDSLPVKRPGSFWWP